MDEERKDSLSSYMNNIDPSHRHTGQTVTQLTSSVSGPRRHISSHICCRAEREGMVQTAAGGAGRQRPLPPVSACWSTNGFRATTPPCAGGRPRVNKPACTPLILFCLGPEAQAQPFVFSCVFQQPFQAVRSVCSLVKGPSPTTTIQHGQMEDTN